MSGLYIHIPYCSQKCIYCDFFSVATRKSKDEYLKALAKEMHLRKDYIKSPVQTLYIGGGTPSSLDCEQLEFVVKNINANFDLSACRELTIEANPENINEEYVDCLLRLGFNRLSMGVQSFDNSDLRLLGRRHDNLKATEAIRIARLRGFNNISIDLMFNLPNQTLKKWEANIDKAIELNCEHLSCYSLTVEQNTMLDKLVAKGKLTLPDEEESLAQFDLTMNKLSAAGYDHYEVSNYCKGGFRSLHNTSYWQGVEYLGLGASAHSFDLESRSHNPANIQQYIDMIAQGLAPQKEFLSPKDRYNEYIMLSLRCKEGIDRKQIEERFPQFLSHFDKQMEKASKYLLLPWHTIDRAAVELML